MKITMEIEAGQLHIRLKKLRKARGMSQNELARQVDMTVQNIQKIEQGRTKSIPYESLDAICKALGYSTKKIMKPDFEQAEPDSRKAHAA